MKTSICSIVVICVVSYLGCSKPVDGSTETQSSPRSPAPQASPSQSPGKEDQEALRLSSEAAASASNAAVARSRNFPAYTADSVKEIKSLKRGEWIPAKIDREYLILREAGIFLAGGDYYVQLLSNAEGKTVKFLLAKKRGTALDQVDFSKGKAADGSFAEVLDFVATVGVPSNKDTRAYCSSSGESGAIWVHLAGSTEEWRGELFGLAKSEKLTPAQ